MLSQRSVLSLNLRPVLLATQPGPGWGTRWSARLRSLRRRRRLARQPTESCAHIEEDPAECTSFVGRAASATEIIAPRPLTKCERRLVKIQGLRRCMHLAAQGTCQKARQFPIPHRRLCGSSPRMICQVRRGFERGRCARGGKSRSQSACGSDVATFRFESSARAT